MKVFKPTFTDKRTGKKRKCSHWYLTFVDNKRIRRRLPGYNNKGASERLGQKIEELLSCGGILNQDLQRWIESLPDKQRRKLIEFGLIDNQRLSANIGKPLDEHLIDFRSALLAKENGEQYAEQVVSRVGFIFTQCGFRVWSDIDANAVYTFLGGLRGEIGQRTFNYYLKSSKQFCRWMIKERRASAPNPLEHLSCIKQTEKRLRRRALTLAEQRTLLEATQSGEAHHNMTGHERGLVYLLALQTGLRANEIRHLTVSAFDFVERSVTVQAGYTKNKQTAVIDLKRETAAELETFLAGKLPNVKAFAMPDQPSKMIQQDLKAADIPYKTDEGQADFHSLRHSYITNLTRQGVWPKDAQVLARHSTITLTMDFYTHVKRESLRKIVEAQPDLTKNLSAACPGGAPKRRLVETSGEKNRIYGQKTALSA